MSKEERSEGTAPEVWESSLDRRELLVKTAAVGGALAVSGALASQVAAAPRAVTRVGRSAQSKTLRG